MVARTIPWLGQLRNLSLHWLRLLEQLGLQGSFKKGLKEGI